MREIDEFRELLYKHPELWEKVRSILTGKEEQEAAQ